MTELRRWNPGDPLTADHFNESIDRLTQIGEIVGDGETTIAVGGPKSTAITALIDNGKRIWFHGIIEDEGPAGEADYSDERYWVRSARPVASATATAALEFAARDSTENAYLWVTCTNITEQVSGTHGLSVGTPIIVWIEIDTLGQTRFWTATGGVNSAIGEYQHMVYQMVTQNEVGFDFVQAHALP